MLVLAPAACKKSRSPGRSLPSAVATPRPAPPAPTTVPRRAPVTAAPDVGLSPDLGRVHYITAHKVATPRMGAMAPLAERTVRIGIGAHAGGLALLWANRGLAPGKRWSAPGGALFKVQLVRLDDLQQRFAAYAAGKLHGAVSSLDQLPLQLEQLRRDPRVIPRVALQLYWDVGGVGVVVRGGIRNVGQLRGKRVVLVQNDATQFLLLNALHHGDVPPDSPRYLYVRTAMEAARAFTQDPTIIAAVSRSPAIQRLSRAPHTRPLLTTRTANRLITGVWFARSDFARKHPAMVQGIVRGVLAAAGELRRSPAGAARGPAVKQALELMHKALGLPPTRRKEIRLCQLPDNQRFFMEPDGLLSFKSSWDDTAKLYRSVDRLSHNEPHTRVMDASVIRRLAPK